MSDVDELLERAKQLQRRLLGITIGGPGWSGNVRDGFIFNPSENVIAEPVTVIPPTLAPCSCGTPIILLQENFDYSIGVPVNLLTPGIDISILYQDPGWTVPVSEFCLIVVSVGGNGASTITCQITLNGVPLVFQSPAVGPVFTVTPGNELHLLSPGKVAIAGSEMTITIISDDNGGINQFGSFAIEGCFI